MKILAGLETKLTGLLKRDRKLKLNEITRQGDTARTIGIEIKMKITIKGFLKNYNNTNILT